VGTTIKFRRSPKASDTKLNLKDLRSKWNNYPLTVTSQKISEKRMDNRGSKLSNLIETINFILKEQRVDGSWLGRYILAQLVFKNIEYMFLA